MPSGEDLQPASELTTGADLRRARIMQETGFDIQHPWLSFARDAMTYLPLAMGPGRVMTPRMSRAVNAFQTAEPPAPQPPPPVSTPHGQIPRAAMEALYAPGRGRTDYLELADAAGRADPLTVWRYLNARRAFNEMEPPPSGRLNGLLPLSALGGAGLLGGQFIPDR